MASAHELWPARFSPDKDAAAEENARVENKRRRAMSLPLIARSLTDLFVGHERTPRRRSCAEPEPKGVVMECVVPPWLGPGDLLSWLSPTGARLGVVVPAGAVDGSVIEFTAPAAYMGTAEPGAPPPHEDFTKCIPDDEGTSEGTSDESLRSESSPGSERRRPDPNPLSPEQIFAAKASGAVVSARLIASRVARARISRGESGRNSFGACGCAPSAAPAVGGGAPAPAGAAPNAVPGVDVVGQRL
jgi:hypothetical protein